MQMALRRYRQLVPCLNRAVLTGGDFWRLARLLGLRVDTVALGRQGPGFYYHYGERQGVLIDAALSGPAWLFVATR